MSLLSQQANPTAAAMYQTASQVTGTASRPVEGLISSRIAAIDDISSRIATQACDLQRFADVLVGVQPPQPVGTSNEIPGGRPNDVATQLAVLVGRLENIEGHLLGTLKRLHTA